MALTSFLYIRVKAAMVEDREKLDHLFGYSKRTKGKMLHIYICAVSHGDPKLHTIVALLAGQLSCIYN
jgi:hypothetical protein